MKLIVLFFTLVFAQGAFASPQVWAQKYPCLSDAKKAAIEILASENRSSGLNEDESPTIVQLKNGYVYVLSGFIQRVFDWQVIVVLDKECKVESSYLHL